MGLWSAFWPVALTYVAVLVTQVFFRANNTGDAVELVLGMAGAHGSGFPLPIPLGDVGYLGPLKDWVFEHGWLVVAPRDAYNSITLPLATNLALTLGLAVIAFCAPNVYQIMGDYSPALSKVRAAGRLAIRWSPSFAWALTCAVLLFAACQYFDQAARFLYFQF
jgi:hypothetical protein